MQLRCSFFNHDVQRSRRMAAATARRKASLSSAKRINRRGRRVRRGKMKPKQRSCYLRNVSK